MNTKNRILAMEAAPAAIPKNPNGAATSAIRKKTKAQYNMIFLLEKAGRTVCAAVGRSFNCREIMHFACQ
jgi:hypothetical protein